MNNQLLFHCLALFLTTILYIYFIYTKTAKLYKKLWPMQKRQHEKSCEIKGGGPEVAVVV